MASLGFLFALVHLTGNRFRLLAILLLNLQRKYQVHYRHSLKSFGPHCVIWWRWDMVVCLQVYLGMSSKSGHLCTGKKNKDKFRSS